MTRTARLLHGYSSCSNILHRDNNSNSNIRHRDNSNISSPRFTIIPPRRRKIILRVEVREEKSILTVEGRERIILLLLLLSEGWTIETETEETERLETEN